MRKQGKAYNLLTNYIIININTTDYYLCLFVDLNMGRLM